MVNERLALVSALAAVALWSTVATGFKLGLAVLAPAQLLLLGSAVSWLFFLTVALATGRVPARFDIGAREFVRAAALGLLNPFCYYLVLFEAYARLPAQVAQPLNYTWAVALALLAVPLLRQPLTARAFAGIAISYGGVAVLLGGAPAGDLDPVGVSLALGSTLIWSFYWIATVRVAVDPVVLMTVSFGAGTIAIAATCIATTGLPRMTFETFGFAAWVGLVEMGITFLLWQTALARTAHAARIAQLIFLSPFLSFVLIDRLLGEDVRPASIVGLGLIVLGLILTQRRPSRPT